MYFALYMYSMPVDLRFRRLRAQKVAVLVPTLRSISRETDFVSLSQQQTKITMGMFGKKDGKFIVLLVRTTAVSLVEVGASGISLVWWRYSEHAGMSGTGPKIANESRISTSDSQDVSFASLLCFG